MDIILDIDEVVADFIKGICVVTGQDPTKVTEWNFFKEAPKPGAKHAAIQALKSYHFWRNLPLIKDAQEGIEYLRTQDHKIIWCSSPYISCEKWGFARMNFLNQHFGARKHDDAMIWARHQDKQYVQGRCFIDDKVSNIESWGAKNERGIAFLFDCPLNRDYQTDYRLSGWEEIMELQFFRSKNV